MADAVSFSPEKFEGLVLFIAGRRQHDEQFGRTKLAKALFYSEFDYYREQGASLTGATYIRMPFGPFPRELEEAEQSLADRHMVHLDYVKDVYEEKRIVPVGSQPDFAALFEPWVLEHAGLWADRVASATAREISRLSHFHPGWLLAGETGAVIPYETALLPQEKPTGLQARRAERIARERGWLSESGVWKWSAV